MSAITSHPALTTAPTDEIIITARKLAYQHARRKLRKDLQSSAEDIAQDVALEVFLTWPKCDLTRGSLKVWVLMITSAHLSRFLKAREREDALRGDLDTVDLYVQVSRKTPIAVAIPAADMPIISSMLAGYSLTSTAERLGLTRKAVRHRLSRIGKISRLKAA